MLILHGLMCAQPRFCLVRRPSLVHRRTLPAAQRSQNRPRLPIGEEMRSRTTRPQLYNAQYQPCEWRRSTEQVILLGRPLSVIITDRRHHIVFRICEQKFRLLMAEERRASRFQRWRQMLLQDLKLLGIPAFYGALRLSRYNQARFRPLVCHGEQRTQAALQRNSA